MKIGIIGVGVLGGTFKNYLLKNTHHEVLTYDIKKDKTTSTLDIISDVCDFIFLSLPTDLDIKTQRLDVSNLTHYIKEISNRTPETKINKIVIRSTVPIGFTREQSEKYPNIKLYFIPEFLTERFAEHDFNNNINIYVGTSDGTDNTCVYSLIPGKNLNTMSYEEAEAIKLFTNSYYSTKIIFFNEIYKLCEKINLNYKFITEKLSENPRIGSEESDICGPDVHMRYSQDGKPGFGGACLPKDSAELASFLELNNISLGLMRKVVDINNQIRK